MLFRGGDVVGTRDVRALDFRVVDGRIAELGPSLPVAGDSVVDLGGLHVLPGAIDSHAHQWEPGFTPTADFRDVTSSAAVGGVTTILDHPLTTPLVVDRATFEDKVALGERTSVVDFGLHGGAAPTRLDELAGLWTAGATGVKVFTCPTGTPLDGFDDPVLLEAAFERLAAMGALILVHAEDAATLDRERARILRHGRGTVDDFDGWHSLDAEIVAVDAVLALATRLRARIYIVHASHPQVVQRVAGVRPETAAYVETCPHYLRLSDSDLRARRAWAMTSPPVRDATARAGLRAQLARGAIDTLGSDHCAIAPAGKDVEAMQAVIPGVPGLDLFLPLLLDLVADGVLELPRVAEVTAANPARIFGLPSKGSLDVGRDGDFAVVDLTATRTVRAEALPGSASWSPYEGRTLRGAVVQTWSRGERIARDGEVEGRPGRGRMLRRSEVPVA